MHQVLIVDDIKMNRLLICNILSTLPQVSFMEVTHGREALDLLAAHEIDLVLLDLMMPVLEGFSVLERMRFCMR